MFEMKKYTEDPNYACFQSSESYIRHVNKDILEAINNNDIVYFVDAFSIESILSTGILKAEFFLLNAHKLDDKQLLSLVHKYSSMRDAISRYGSGYHLRSKRLFPLTESELNTESSMCFEYIYDEFRARNGGERWYSISALNFTNQLELFA